MFQPGQAAGVNCVYHFSFTGQENALLTVVIRDQKLQVSPGNQGQADLHVMADSQTWLGVIAKDKSMLWALADAAKYGSRALPRCCWPSRDVLRR